MPPAPKKKIVSNTEPTITWPFGKKNYLLFGVAMAVIVIGFILLGYGSITMAPFLLVVGYCILIPIAIMAKNGSKESQAGASESSKLDA